jgi:protein SCO1/2
LRPKTRVLLSVAAAVVAVTVFLVLLPMFSGPRYRPSIELNPTPLQDFKLTDQYGREFRLSDIRGKPVFLFFGYAYCPDICPLVMYKWAYAIRQLGPEADKIAFIFISQDPWRDTPEQLRAWVERFDERIITLTGRLEELEPVWRAYSAIPIYTDMKGNPIKNPIEYAQRGEPYLVTHIGFVYVADRGHVARFVLTAEMPQEEYLEAAKYILSQ